MRAYGGDNLSRKKLALRMPTLTPTQRRAIATHRADVARILRGDDSRMLLIIGPCSAWPSDAVLEYAARMRSLADDVRDTVKIVLRVYTQKPRTTVGWRGPLFEPDPCGAPRIAAGMRAMHTLMARITDMRLAIADEALFIPASTYLEDYYAYAAIGARSAEDQEHRSFAATRPYAVGIKNPTSGNLDIAVNALRAAHAPNSFYAEGVEWRSDGNPDAHLVLRGGARPNYRTRDLLRADAALRDAGLPRALIIDTNHDNSRKRHDTQPAIVRSVLRSMEREPMLRNAVKGFMIESFLHDGRGDIDCTDARASNTGLSITDPCLGWEHTESLVRAIAEQRRRA